MQARGFFANDGEGLMTTAKLLAALCCILTYPFLCMLPAQAQATHVFVSGQGVDTAAVRWSRRAVLSHMP
jgi:hypothetical protein